MTHMDFLDAVIERGIAAARRDYARPDQRLKLEGSLAGFEACRGLDPAQLAALLGEARRATLEAYREDRQDYWRVRCREAEIEWVANCLSFMLLQAGLPVIVPPTARAAMTCAEIVGIAGARA